MYGSSGTLSIDGKEDCKKNQNAVGNKGKPEPEKFNQIAQFRALGVYDIMHYIK